MIDDNYYQNNVYFDVITGYNKNTISFDINYDYLESTVDLSNGVYTSGVLSSTFPIVKENLPTAVLKYLNASPLVESENSSIEYKASTITSGCTDLRIAIIKLCKWIESNISMKSFNPSNKSSDVFSNKIADCDGAAHLLAAFCRSLNIPARVAVGYYMENLFNFPINKDGSQKYSWGTPGNDYHATCEIYIPYMSKWVRCDPAQRTVLFGNQNFIKMASGLESTDLLATGALYYASTSQTPRPTLTQITIEPSVIIHSNNSNYQFVNSETFPIDNLLTLNFGLFCAYDPSLSVGFNDKVTIQDPPTGTTSNSGIVPNNTYTMTPCSPANFYAKFVSETIPQTYSTGFDWSIVLYKSNGDEYVYAQQNAIMSNTYTPNDNGEGCFWQPYIGILPAYDWLYDPSGNIYGKVRTTVHISDGDTKYDETTIGVNRYNFIQNVTYTTNTTINGCAELNLTNVNITGTPTIIFNTNGLGMTINGTFEAPLGSTLIINQ